MDEISLQLAATGIVARNVTPNLSAAIVEWDQDRRWLGLRCFFDAAPDDEDGDAMEHSMAELLSEFPEVEKAGTSITVGQLGAGEGGAVVYVRP